jgi:enoyl-CoA hydratase
MSNDLIITEKIEHVGIVKLNRAQKKNALNNEMFFELKQAIEKIKNDDEIYCLILTTTSKDFSVGLDLTSLTTSQSTTGKTSKASAAKNLYNFIKELQDCVGILASIKIPVIACVSGYCIGGGLDLISACDLRIASQDTVFSIRETKMAIVADLGSLQRLPYIMNFSKFLELAYTGRDFSAHEAFEAGLVNQVAQNYEHAYQLALSLAKEIASNSPMAVQGTKQVIFHQLSSLINQELDYVALYNAAFLQSNDLIEAITAFFEKRKPKFTGS